MSIVTAVNGAKHSFVETQGQLCTRSTPTLNFRPLPLNLIPKPKHSSVETQGQLCPR